ncbi:MAG: zinc ribbon domain-containing protein [Phycisphaerae bacterium]|nr:zinc ribbon domain-containing protein [Phycisphaerae bacterium]
MIADALLAIPDWVFNSVHYLDEVAGVVGGVMIGAGLAGRRAGWAPRCSACNFDVRAVPEGAAQCPECGASLAHKKAIRYGLRARRWGLASCGAAVLALAVWSTMAGWPFAAIMWRQNVIASVFTYDKLMDRAIAGGAGGAGALSELAAELNGIGRRRSKGPGFRPGQDCLLALLDRMEADPASRATLLPLATNPIPYMRSRDSGEPVRLAKILCQVAAAEPELLASLSASNLNQAFQSSGANAIAQLLSDPAMVQFLYRGGGTVKRVREPSIELTIQPSFNSSVLSGSGIWSFESPFVAEVLSARWRVKGAPESEWRRIRKTAQRSHRRDAEVHFSIDDAPESGEIEVQVDGRLIRRELQSLSPAGNNSTEDSSSIPGIPFTWRMDVSLTPRDSLVLTPETVQPGTQAQSWLQDAVSRAIVTKHPADGPDCFALLTEALAGANISGSLVVLQATLRQGDQAWPGTISSGTGAERFAGFRPDGFDPSQPFSVFLSPDLAALRARAQGDLTYVDAYVTASFDALDRPPTAIEVRPTP